MREVDKKEFFKIINENELDICVNSEYIKGGQWGKTLIKTKFTYRNGIIFGESITNYDLDSDNYGKVTYFIKE